MFLLEREGQKQLLRHAQVMISHRKSKEVLNIAWFGHTNLLLFKKRTFNRHFSRPAETDPYMSNMSVWRKVIPSLCLISAPATVAVARKELNWLALCVFHISLPLKRFPTKTQKKCNKFIWELASM